MGNRKRYADIVIIVMINIRTVKYTVLLIFVFNSIVVSAQKHNLFADIGLSLSRFYPGISATYNYKPLSWIGVGAGSHAHSYYPTITNSQQYVPALFCELRITIRPKKVNQFFVFTNLGINFYKCTDGYHIDAEGIYQVSNDNGFYSSYGIGYFHKITKRGGGIYLSLKTSTNGYKTDTYDFNFQRQGTDSWVRGTAVIASGFKF